MEISKPIHTSCGRSIVPAWGVTLAATGVAGIAGAWCAARGNMTAWMALVCMAGAALALMPSIAVLSFFAVFLTFGHQFRSFAVFPVAGIEWHPRELAFILVVAHAAVQAMRHRFDAHLGRTHFFVFSFGMFYLLAAAVGIFREQPLGGVVSESRNALFLLVFFVFTACIPGKSALRAISMALLACSALVAVGSVAFFVYVSATGRIVNVQNAWGEYVPRLFTPLILQSSRPNGHMFFEVSLVVLVSLLFAPARAGRWRPLGRLGGICLIFLFCVAILLTMMRTSYVAVIVSLLALGLLCLPARVQSYLFAGAGCITLLVAAGLAANVQDIVAQWLPEVEVSLKGRLVEVSGAWEAFLAHPFVGNGLGATFTALGFVAKTTQDTFHASEYQMLHNAWMYYLFKGGLAGLGLALLGLGGIFAGGWGAMLRCDAVWDRLFLRGVLAGYAGQLVAALTMPRLLYPQGLVYIALLAYAVAVYSGDAASTAQREAARAPCDEKAEK